MQTIFLTRKKYNELTKCFKEDKEMLEAYNASKRDWSTEGVHITTDDVQLLQVLDQILYH